VSPHAEDRTLWNERQRRALWHEEGVFALNHEPVALSIRDNEDRSTFREIPGVLRQVNSRLQNGAAASQNTTRAAGASRAKL
jgi:hypothetical protein